MGEKPAPSALSFPRAVVFAALLAALSVVLRIGIYLSLSASAPDARYVLGCVEGVGIDLALGLVVAAPLLLGARVGALLSLPLAALLLFATVAGAHYHAVFLRLPTRSTLVYLGELRMLASSVRAHAPVERLALLSVLPAGLALVVANRVAPWASRVLRPRARRRGALLVLALLPALSLARARGAEGQELYGALGPVLHVARPEGVASSFAVAGAAGPGSAEELARLADVQAALATDNPGPPADPRFPFCSAPAPAPASPSAQRRSAMLLILESVDSRAMELEIAGRPVMPNLRRIAADGVSFRHFYATGHQSAHAMPALFAGVPAVPFRALLQHAPLAHVLGFPRVLRDAGWSTVYFHGSDLSFEQQREFLKRAGFARIVEPSPLSSDRLYGWGQPDEVLFDEVRGFVEAQRRDHPEQPYFAGVFTVSTHDPYELPPAWKPRFGRPGELGQLVESLAYLDDALGRFYEWFSREEAPKGTLLAITGDHAPRVSFPGDPKDTSTGEFEYRFAVPLLLLGLDAEDARRARSAAERGVGGHHDVPATLLAALGQAKLACQQGRSLLSEDVPARRVVTSVAGESLEFLYAHEQGRRWMLSLKSGRLALYDPDRDPTFRHDLSVGDPRAPEVRRLLSSYLALMKPIVEADRLAPPEPSRQRAKLGTVSVPLFVAHRALTRGAMSPRPNSVAAIEQAIADGAAWVEIDLSTTSDRVPIVYHDEYFPLPDGTRVLVSQLSLAGLRAQPGGAAIPTLEDVLSKFAGRVGFCLELKPEPQVADMLSLTRTTLRLLDRLPAASRVMIDSFDHMMLGTVREFSRWPVGYDLPQKPIQMEWLDFARDRGFDWVYLRHELATPTIVRAAHERGLRVMVYPPASPSDLPSLSTERPDGVMTEEWHAFDSWRR
jgi:glycerophosphoryl diester phosphodiesterase/arylsulfatase A-like enzyme